MEAISRFYFDGLSGVGAWSLLLLLGAVIAAWVVADSENRGIEGKAWILGSLFPLLVLLMSGLLDTYDAITLSFSSLEWQWTDAMSIAGLSAFALSLLVSMLYFALNRGSKPEDSPKLVSPSAYFEAKTIIELESEAKTLVEGLVAPKGAALGYLYSQQGAYPLHAGTNTLGRAESQNSIKLEDPYVSRWHAVIWVAEGRFVIANWDSKTGTFVNEEMVSNTGRILQHNDLIRVGQTQLRVGLNNA